MSREKIIIVVTIVYLMVFIGCASNPKCIEGNRIYLPSGDWNFRGDICEFNKDWCNPDCWKEGNK